MMDRKCTRNTDAWGYTCPRVFILLGLVVFASCDLERIESVIQLPMTFKTQLGSSDYETAYDILVNSDSTYVVVGLYAKVSSQNNGEAYIAKLNAEGDTLYSRYYGGARNERAVSVVSAADGFIMMGVAEENLSQYGDIIAYKVDDSLKLVWPARLLVDTSPDFGEPIGIVQGLPGQYILAYAVYDMFGMFKQLNFLKINEEGQILQNMIVLQSFEVVDPKFNKMIKTGNNDIIIVGSATLAGTSSYYIKFDLNGEIIHEETLDNSLSFGLNAAHGVVHLSDNSAYVVGSARPTGNPLFLMLGYRGDGVLKVDTFWGGIKPQGLLAVTKSLEDDIVVMGYTTSFSADEEIYLAKLNKSGQEIWSHHFEMAHPLVGDIELCPDGGFVICTTISDPSDILVIKTDSDGNFE